MHKLLTWILVPKVLAIESLLWRTDHSFGVVAGRQFLQRESQKISIIGKLLPLIHYNKKDEYNEISSKNMLNTRIKWPLTSVVLHAVLVEAIGLLTALFKLRNELLKQIFHSILFLLFFFSRCGVLQGSPCLCLWLGRWILVDFWLNHFAWYRLLSAYFVFNSLIGCVCPLRWVSFCCSILRNSSSDSVYLMYKRENSLDSFEFYLWHHNLEFQG